MTPPTPPGDESFTAGQHALHALNFFTAAMQTGFGPFVSVWLISQGWSLTEVGFALSIGTIAALCGQLPGGVLVDAVHHKRNLTAAALGLVALSALLIAMVPSIPAIWGAEVLHAAGSVLLTPAIAALTLALCGTESFSERLGGNARFASIGAALAAAGFGFAATHLGQRSIFFLAAALAIPAAASLLAIRPGPCPPAAEDHMALAHPKERDTAPWIIFRDPTMHVFALCVILFHLSNAALLPLALGDLARRHQITAWLVPAAIVIPQIITAIASPWAGTAAKRFGRRLVLLIGFAALPLRALLFATNPGPWALDAMQVLDGVSATVLGLMLPLIAADLTRDTGHLNLAMGSFGLAAGLGATFSTTVAGWMADRFDVQVAFFGLAAAGTAATCLLAFAMPETAREAARRPAPLA